MSESKYRRCDDIIETELGNTTGNPYLHAEVVAIKEPGGKRSLVKNMIAQQTSLNKPLMEPCLNLFAGLLYF